MTSLSMQYKNRMFQVMHVVREQLMSMEPGTALLNGKTWDGPTPDFALIYGNSLRLREFSKLWTTCFIITPATDKDVGRVVTRTDRLLEIIVTGFAQLTDPEQRADAAMCGVGVKYEQDLLATRMDCLAEDFRNLFYSNLNLVTDDCPTGIVDDSSLDIQWIEDAEWPQSAFAATIVYQTSQY